MVEPLADASGSRREQNKARTRAAILDASLGCITERGLQATTMDQIAAAAEIARATLFNYFPSKTTIVDALVAESDAGFFAAIDGWRQEPKLGTGSRLLGLFAATASFLQRASARRRTLVSLSWLHWADQQSVVRIRETRAAFERLLDDGREAGDVPAALDTERAADVICNTYMGLVHSWWMEEEEPVDRRFAEAARLLAKMIDPDVRLPHNPPKLQPQPTAENDGL